MNTSIIINDRNRARLADRIEAGQGRATARTLNVDDLRWAAGELEDRLDGIPVVDRVGATAVIGTGDALANSYRYAAHGTFARLERRPTGWALIDTYRTFVPTRSGGGQVDPVVTLVIDDRQSGRLATAVLRDRRITVRAEVPGALSTMLAVAGNEEVLRLIADPEDDTATADAYAAMATVDPDGFCDWVSDGGPLPVALAALRRLAAEFRATVIGTARTRVAVSG